MEGNEILAVVDSVSNEKGLEKDSIFEAIELAIASASQRHFHEDAELHVKIDRVTGKYNTYRNWIVADEDDLQREISKRVKQITPEHPDWDEQKILDKATSQVRAEHMKRTAEDYINYTATRDDGLIQLIIDREH